MNLVENYIIQRMVLLQSAIYSEHNIDNSIILTMRGAVTKIFVKNGKVIKIIRIAEK